MTFKQDLTVFRRQCTGYSQGNSQDRELWAIWKRLEARALLLDSLYQEVKDNPGAMPSPESCAIVNLLNRSR